MVRPDQYKGRGRKLARAATALQANTSSGDRIVSAKFVKFVKSMKTPLNKLRAWYKVLSR
jgi:hypothetical protein